MTHSLTTEPIVYFFLVGIGARVGMAMGIDRYVRRNATPDELDPWVRISCQPGRSREVHRFTEAEGKAWAAERKKLKGTHCRVVASRGPEIEEESR